MNNVDISRYSKKIVSLFIDSEPTNDHITPIWCLGRHYQETRPRDEASTATPASTSGFARPSLDKQTHEGSFEIVKGGRNAPSHEQGETGSIWPDGFLDAFNSRIWMTYRSGFAPIPRSEDPRATAAITLAVRMKNIGNNLGFTSDAGWGCMIRSGQSLLANALAINTLGRDWTWSERTAREEASIVAMFADDGRAPFSIHKFVEHGAAACGTYPGQWFGPSATARCIEALTNACPEAGLRVYATDNTPEVLTERLFSPSEGSESKATFKPTLLLVGTRLGIDHITPVYREALLSTLQMPQSVGIAGGRPSSAHYFIGTQGSSFFYLDPHFTRPHLPLHDDVSDYTLEELASCHTRRLRALSIEDMDPSMLIGFLFRTADDWLDWKLRVETWPGRRIFHIQDEVQSALDSARHAALDEVSTFDTEESEDDDYVVDGEDVPHS